MSTKQDTQFSFENCSCMEMMSQMMSNSKDKQGAGSTCAEMMSQMMDSCCGMQQEGDETIT